MTLLSVAALVIAALFTGAALYITLVEQPARLTLDDGPMLAQWQPSYARALPIQAGLVIAGGVAGLAAWYVPGNWQCLAGAAVLLANWPLTLLVIFPVNKRLNAIRPDQADNKARLLLRKWGRLHDLRSVLGGVATLLFAWALIGLR